MTNDAQSNFRDDLSLHQDGGEKKDYLRMYETSAYVA